MSAVPPPPPPAMKYAPKKLPPKLIPQPRPAPAPAPPSAIGGAATDPHVSSTPPPQQQSPSSQLAIQPSTAVPSPVRVARSDSYGGESPAHNCATGTAHYPHQPSASLVAAAAAETTAVVYPPSTRVISPPRVGGGHYSSGDTPHHQHQHQHGHSNTMTNVLHAAMHMGGGGPPPGTSDMGAVGAGAAGGSGLRSSSPPSKFPTVSSISNNSMNTAAFNAMQQVTKEQQGTIKELERLVANLTRDNNALQGRVAMLLDCGLTPDLASHEAYKASSAAVARGVFGVQQQYGGGGGPSALMDEEFSELRFLKTRVRRLEAALQLEMKARDQLDLKCAAQQVALTQVLAKQQEQQQQGQYGGQQQQQQQYPKYR